MSFLVEGFGIRPIALIKGLCGISIRQPLRVPATKALKTPLGLITDNFFQLSMAQISAMLIKIYEACFDVKVDGRSLHACSLSFIC